MNIKTLHLLSGAILLALIPSTQAVTLDWNSVSWGTGGTLSQSFDIDGSNPGNDITITVSGDTGGLLTGSPDDNTNITGGFGGTNETLFLGTNHAADNNYLLVTIQFTYTLGVQNIGFTLMDIDRDPGNFRDGVYLFQGFRYGTEVTQATLTDSANNSLGTLGGYQYVIGDTSTAENSGAANVGVAYGSTVVDTISFRWYNVDENGQQYIGIGDITYTAAVPEPSTYAAGILLLGVGAFHFLKKRRNQYNLAV